MFNLTISGSVERPQKTRDGNPVTDAQGKPVTETWYFYGDDDNKDYFYIIPKPDWSYVNGKPNFTLTKYLMSGSSLDGTGYCTGTIGLHVPDDVVDLVADHIKNSPTFGSSSPEFLALPVEAGSTLRITYPDGQGGTVDADFAASDFGNNAAAFFFDLDKDQIKEFAANLATSGSSSIMVRYTLGVKARMPAVKVVIDFDATAALNYQVTEHAHKKWACKTTYTYDISTAITDESGATVEVSPYDAKNNNDTFKKPYRDWAQTVIAERINEQIQRIAALRAKATGHESFEITELTSFHETYLEDQIVTWAQSPNRTLPAFGTPSSDWEAAVDKRKLQVTLTPNVPFPGATGYLSEDTTKMLLTGPNHPFAEITKVKELTVTLHYPTIEGREGQSYTFQANEPHLWEMDWDDAAGDRYTIAYVALYETNQVVTGTINAQGNSYPITLEHLGTLYVQFDASKFFYGREEGGTPDPATADVEAIEVNFFFDTIDRPYLQTFTLGRGQDDEGNDKSRKTVYSLFGYPIGTFYAYSMIYKFKTEIGAPDYYTDARKSSASIQAIDSPVANVALNVGMKLYDKNPNQGGVAQITNGELSLWYEDAPTFPDIKASEVLPHPTKRGPLRYSYDSSSTPEVFDLQKQYVFASARTSLQLVGSFLTDEYDSISIGPLEFDMMSAKIMPFLKDEGPLFIKLDPSIVEWKLDADGNPGLTGISLVHARMSYMSGGQTVVVPTPYETNSPLQYNTGTKQAYPVYFYSSGIPYAHSDLGFNYYVEYAYKTGKKVLVGWQEGLTLVLPKEATLDPFDRLTIDPRGIAWSGLTSVNVQLKKVYYTEDGTPKTVTPPGLTQVFDENTNNTTQYVSISALSELEGQFTDLAFDWAATYNYASGVKYASGKATGSVLNLPATATGDAPT